MYALEAIAGFSTIFEPVSLCDNFHSHIDRFTESGFFVWELEGIFCGTTCSSLKAKDISAVIKQLQKYRSKIFETQISSAISNNVGTWTKLCDEMDPKSLKTLFDSTSVLDLVCAKAGKPAPHKQPDTQPYPPNFSIDKYYSLQASLAGYEAHVSFRTPVDLMPACSKISSATHDLVKLSLPVADFQTALCGSGTVATPDEIHTHIEEHFGELFVQALWLAGSSVAYRSLVCDGYKSADGLTAYSATGIQEVGFRIEQVTGWMSERCAAWNV
jgi:hypothetical protein